MKKTIIYLLPLLIGFASCKKETSIENGGSQSGNFTAVIDGAQWSASGTKQGASILGGIINITGISPDNREISITIADSTSTAGVFKVNQATASYAAYADIDSSDLYAFSTNQGADTSQAGGSVTITQIDPASMTISGTFAFKVYRDLDGHQKTITSGVFTRIPYVTSLPATASTDTLQATIDNKAWSAVNIQATATSGQLTIVGASSDGSQTVGLLLPANAAAGTYALDGTTSLLGAYTLVASATSAGFISTKGTLTVSSNNTSTSRIRGSFSFTATDPTGVNTATHAITNGVFSVYYGQ